MSGRLERWADRWRLLSLSARLIAGRRYWIAPLLTLGWIAFQIFRLLVGWRPEAYTAADAQTVLIGAPLAALGAGLGMRVIAGDIDRRTLEIAYTVPGGAHRVWLAKIVAAVGLIAAAELLLAIATWVFCTSFPAGAVYGAFQAAVFYLVVGMGLATLFKSEATGGLVTIVVAALATFLQAANLRVSPHWNPLNLESSDPADVLAWTVQNRIGTALLLAALVLLIFRRAERREKMLSG